jgi:hypothetical protein
MNANELIRIKLGGLTPLTPIEENNARSAMIKRIEVFKARNEEVTEQFQDRLTPDMKIRREMKVKTYALILKEIREHPDLISFLRDLANEAETCSKCAKKTKFTRELRVYFDAVSEVLNLTVRIGIREILKNKIIEVV